MLIQQKRKHAELGDITNNNDMRKRTKQSLPISRATRLHQPQQQRLPLPTDISDMDGVKLGRKQVTFALGTEKNGMEKSYHESPLLTPKEEEYDEEYDKEYQKEYTKISGVEVNSDNQPEYEQYDADLDKNADYLALLLTLRLLYASKDRIHSQVVSLSQLLDFHANSASKEDVIEFVMKLIGNELDLPGQNKIIKTPMIDWSRYHKALNVSSNWHTQAEEPPMFKTLNLFEK